LSVTADYAGATGTYHRLTDAEVKRRHLLFGAKRGYTDGNFPLPLTDDQRDELDSVHERLRAENMIEVRDGCVELTTLGYLFVQWVQQQYDQVFRNSADSGGGSTRPGGRPSAQSL
jgi:hypothetical protein